MSWRVFVLVFLMPAFCFAQAQPVMTIETTPIQAIPPGDDSIVSIDAGSEAPFSGQLFSPDTALRWANYMEQYKLKLRIDMDLQRKICAIEYEYRDARLRLEQESFAKIEADLRQRLLAAEQENVDLQEGLLNPPWHKTRTFGLIVGIVGTSLVAGLSAWAVIEIKN